MTIKSFLKTDKTEICRKNEQCKLNLNGGEGIKCRFNIAFLNYIQAADIKMSFDDDDVGKRGHKLTLMLSFKREKIDVH